MQAGVSAGEQKRRGVAWIDDVPVDRGHHVHAEARRVCLPHHPLYRAERARDSAWGLEFGFVGVIFLHAGYASPTIRCISRNVSKTLLGLES